MKTYKYNNVIKTISEGSFLYIEDFDLQRGRCYSIVFKPLKGTFSRNGEHLVVHTHFEALNAGWLLGEEGQPLVDYFRGKELAAPIDLEYLELQVCDDLVTNGSTPAIRARAAKRANVVEGVCFGE